MILVNVIRLYWPKSWGTTTLVECTASTVPVTRISRARLGGSALGVSAAGVTVGAGREHEQRRKRTAAARWHTRSFMKCSQIRRRGWRKGLVEIGRKWFF